LERFGGALKADADGIGEGSPGEFFHGGHGLPQGDPGGVLKEIVTAGSWPRWFTVRGPTPSEIEATAFRGISVPWEERI